jgi:hypothetical protein
MSERDTIHRLKITLRDVRPPIWRRFEVRSGINLASLHDAVQVVMGWTNSHLHMFEIGGGSFSALDPGDPYDSDVHDETKAFVGDLLTRKGQKLRYDYDFGDGWEHDILVEAIEPADPARLYPICLAGRRCCPPEDCGGPYRYPEVLAAAADPEHAEHDEISEWLGEEFDPEAFDIDLVNALLQRRERKARQRRTR